MSIVGGTWTYSGSPGTDSKDAVRFLIGDTDTNDQLLSDEEILWLIATEATVYKAAAMSCRSIKSSGRLVDKRVGDLHIAGSQRAQQYDELARALERRSAMGAVPYVGGISVSGKLGVESDTDRVVPAFKVGMHDYLTASTST